ncbi:mechanosensitive ion channel family protein, partial [Planosporangium flavigriseum]
MILFVIILVLGWLAARLLRAGASRLLRRVGFDQAVERGGLGRVLGYTRYDARTLMTTIVYYAVLLFTLQLAFGIWGPNPVSALIAGIVAWLPRAFVAIIIIVVAAAIASGVRNVITGALGSLSYGRLLARVASAFIIGIGMIAALDQIGVATSVTTPVLITILATIGGILVVGVGGGLVRPMQSRWESWLNRAEREVPQVRQQLRVAAEERETARREAAEREAAARREAEERAAREKAEAEARAAAEREAAARREAEERAAREKA